MEGLAVPFRPGGLFLEFARQILDNGFRMPLRIPFYSEGGIPFAYPPLPFYVLAGLLHIFPSSEIVIANLLPPLTSLVSLPLFLQLTKEWKLDRATQIGAMFAFAAMPAAFIEQIESAGLAEAFGQIATILLAISLTRAYRSHSTGKCLLAGLAWAISVVSSPGSAYASAPMFVLFAAAWLLRDKERKPLIGAFLPLLATGLAAALLSSPYWWTVVRNHGIGVFTASIEAQNGGTVGWIRFALSRIIAFNVAGGAFGFWANALVLAGVIWALLRRRWVLVTWFLILISVPSEGRWLVPLPASILAGLGIAQLLAILDRSPGILVRWVAIAVFAVGLLFNPAWAIRGFVSMYNTET